MVEFFSKTYKVLEGWGKTIDQETIELLEREGVDIDENTDIRSVGDYGRLALYIDGRFQCLPLAHIVDNTDRYNLKEIKEGRFKKDFIEELHRIHLYECQTIKTAKKEGWKDKYKGEYKKNEKYNYTFIKDNKVIHKFQDQKLFICKNCTKMANKERGTTYSHNKFPVKDYLKKDDDKYSKFFESLSPAGTSPTNIYNNNRSSKIKRNAVKEKANWGCMELECPYSDISYDKKYVHVHHKDMIKSNDSSENLKALCIYCHSQKPQHHRLKKQKNYKDFIQKYGEPRK